MATELRQDVPQEPAGLRVTRYRPGDLSAAGDCPYQSGPGDGLPAYVSGNESVRDTGIVVWHTLVSTTSSGPRTGPSCPLPRRARALPGR